MDFVRGSFAFDYLKCPIFKNSSIVCSVRYNKADRLRFAGGLKMTQSTTMALTRSRPKKKRGRDARVELVRLIACLIVLLCHSYPPVIINGEPAFGRVFIACLVADGVGIFWMVIGCFLFSSTYGKTLKRGFTRIFIPLVLASLLGIAMNSLPLPGFVPSDIPAVLNDFLQWRNGVIGMDHLWYLYVNLLVFLFFPVLKWIADGLDRSRVATILFMAATLGFFIVNDLTSNHLAGFSHYLFRAAIPASIEVIWGHILYRNRKHFHGWITAAAALAGFVFLNLARARVQMKHFAADPGDASALYWYSAWGMLASALILIFGLAAIRPRKGAKKAVEAGAESMICAAASYSFLIYIVHFPILRILTSVGFTQSLQNLILKSNGFAFSLLYTLCMEAILFVLSFILSWIVKWLWKGIKMLFQPEKVYG